MAEFLILIGGPGLFKSCDPKHDKIWLNYFYPMKLAAEENLYDASDENVHWIVYEPAYRNRWLDDDEITTLEAVGELFSGKSLHTVRKDHASKIRPAANYLQYIGIEAKKRGIAYHGINATSEFWGILVGLRAKTISRVWYCGHATQQGLILELGHNENCAASWVDESTILTVEIAKQAALKDKFVATTQVSSQFFGCHTSDFAQAWTTTFGVPSEGAAKSITFQKVLTSGRRNVLADMKTTPTPEGAPGWTRYAPGGAQSPP